MSLTFISKPHTKSMQLKNTHQNKTYSKYSKDYYFFFFLRERERDRDLALGTLVGIST